MSNVHYLPALLPPQTRWLGFALRLLGAGIALLMALQALLRLFA